MSGWIKIIPPKLLHACGTPEKIPVGTCVGSEWACPECSQVWVVKLDIVYWGGKFLQRQRPMVYKNDSEDT